MNITFTDLDRMSTENFANVRGTTTELNASSTGVERGISLDISSKVTDNAYKVQGRTMKDVADAAKAMDPEVQSDFMTVMSNCVSTEDLAKMQREGYTPSDVEFKDVVSIVDHIKAAMIKGGAEVIGYTDSISDEALLKITGSESFANKLKSECRTKDIPLTEENAEEIVKAFNKLSELPPLSDASEKYLVENDLAPSVDNIYTATYSAGNNADSQGRGYYNTGVQGYLAKKADVIDVEALKPQMEEIVKESGYEVNEENVEKALWLVKKGVPLTDETYKSFMEIEKVSLPMSFEEFADHATDAIMDGIHVADADLSKTTSLRKQAVEIYDEVSNYGTIKGRRTLEEVRLKMTVEANLKLLRSGFSIDTAPMEELIQNLKEIEKEFAINLTGDTDEIEAVRKKNIFEDTVYAVNNIKTAPINIVSTVEATESLSQISVSSENLKDEFLKAGKAYEELMTAPRRDLGDSIQKAFTNIDDMLSDMKLALTEENRRAVRILGYSNMEITSDNIAAIREKDALLTDTIENMTPSRVLSMIRDNVNPLETSIEDLNKYLKNLESAKDDILGYSKFLYKVSKDKRISEDEKEAYIGIYRLVRQLEKNDFSSIGAIEELGKEFNFENMLSALRSRKHKNMDYKIDESFGGVEAIDRGIASITSQIARGYISDTKDLKNVLDFLGDENAEMEFDEQEASDFRAALKTEAEVIAELRNMDLPVTASNLNDMQMMLESPMSIFDRLKKAGFKKDKEIDLSGKDKAKESFREFSGSVKDFIEKEVFGRNTISAAEAMEFSTMHRQMDFLNKTSEEENFLIPIETDGSITAVNLKVVHKDTGSKVEISFETEKTGRLAAEFKVADNGLSGYCIGSDEGINTKYDASSLKNEMAKEGINLKDMYFSYDEELDLKSFKIGDASDKSNDTDVISSDDLYKAAKVFIEFMCRP